uniref:Uncharacterized protein n=1 Tax=Molossus molossus TaxID=27622 RepID=A0A7J8BJP8_MOLMO|nr:hypothetical protein HJG59_010196 [Molossus molossus]
MRGHGARPSATKAVFMWAGSPYSCPTSVLVAATGPWPPGRGMSLSSLLRSCLGLVPEKLGPVRGEGSCPRPGLYSSVRWRQVQGGQVESLVVGGGWAVSLPEANGYLCLGWGLQLIVFGLKSQSGEGDTSGLQLTGEGLKVAWQLCFPFLSSSSSVWFHIP